MRSVFNWIIATFVVLVVFAAAVIIVLVATMTISYDFLPFDWFDTVLSRVAEVTGGEEAAVIGISILIILITFALLVAEVTPIREKVYRISSDQSGEVKVDYDSVVLLAEKAAIQAHNVHDVRCKAAMKQDGLAVTCFAALNLSSSVPEVSSEIKEKIKESVERFMGLPVIEVIVKTHYRKKDSKHRSVQ